MAEADNGGERTEEPTQQRREDFRRRGQVAQTKELASVLVIFGGLLCVWFLGRFFMQQIHEVFVESFTGYLVSPVRDGDWQAALMFAFKKTAFVIGPIAAILWIFSVSSSLIQVGILNNEDALAFKPERIDPVQGFKKIFSFRSVIEAVKAMFKIGLVACVAYFVIRGEMKTVPLLSSFSVAQLMEYLGHLTFRLFSSIGALMAVMAAFDYFFQRWDLEKQMRMTKQELKEEMKSREGDPLIKARIRRVQREIASRRMMEDVPKADVVITNPTHIAVALRYSENMIAPTLVAKGAGVIAEKIKALAKENKVPVIENKPLARTIYKTLKIGQAIPRELYTAVAEILSYVYRLKRKVLN